MKDCKLNITGDQKNLKQFEISKGSWSQSNFENFELVTSSCEIWRI